MDLNTTLVKFETFEISPQVNVTTITIDLPFALDSAYYAGTGSEDWCDANGRLSDPETYREVFGDDFAEVEKEFCDKTYYAIDGSEQCGSRSCVFKDESDVMGVKKQFTMTPYMTKCDPADLTYDHNVYSWFPSGCTKQSNAAFLFGLGSYVTGNFERRPGKGALITKPQRHYVVTFGKLTSRFEDLSARFKAKCNDGHCDGLLHKLEKVSDAAPKAKDKAQVLMVGKKSIRTPHQNYTMRSPLTLVSLNTPKFYYATQGAESDETYTYYTWEHLDLKFLNTTYKESDGLELEKGSCSLIIDSYLDQVNKNHYYVSDPLQVLYTSAIYYLFQDAAVKEVELPSSNKLGVVDLSQAYIGSTRMKGDREKKEIKYSIPIVSAVSTFIGIIVLLVYSSIVLQVPQERVKENDEPNFAAKYADVLIDDSYPKRVHRRRLELPNGERIEMDEYGVESIRFAHEHEPDVKVTL
ncbi:hypothetical protein Poli38472_012409 [Pythium oligandrum]|uniref:Uncharacterized protein n=1 Tax=Pythium oligandrum TaxID=41045 RepID=A0A8K1CQT8_PYTOL|nr:hypothetical protein Poli38472_012409 [Pythium oligandrum]|eukprot:TMW67293.1 hypothetical protein Poli38472_012409 [Pythium oligandrum]